MFRYLNDYPITSFVTLTSFIIVALIATYYILRKKRKKYASWILLFSTIYFVVALAGSWMYPLGVPLLLIRDVIPVIIGITLASRVYPQKHEPDYSKPDVLHTTVTKILDSNDFLTALRTTLPRGKDDEQFGLDYIPFMLNSIDERRRRAIKSARLFLISTVVAALVFSMVVMYFGYILVNESSAGAAKSLADIESSVESINTSLKFLLPSYYGNPEFQKTVVPALERLEQIAPDPKNTTQRDQTFAAISQARSNGDFTLLANALRRITPAEGTQNSDYARALADAQKALDRFSAEQTIAIPTLSTRLQDLSSLIPKAEDVISKPESRVPEIIKRLALGLVIATFFLALLRYMGGLYRTRYLQVLAAEADDFAIRRFYVAFKSSTPNDEQRKAVLSGFMSSPTQNEKDGTSSTDESTKEQYEILKDLLGALTKKL